MYSLWFMSTFPAEALPRSVCSTEGESVGPGRYSIKGFWKGTLSTKRKKSGSGGSSSLRWEVLVENDEDESLKRLGLGQSRSWATTRTLNYIVALWWAVGIGGLLDFFLWCGVGFGPGVCLAVEEWHSPTISWKNKDIKWAWCLIMKDFSACSLFVFILGNYSLTAKRLKEPFVIFTALCCL